MRRIAPAPTRCATGQREEEEADATLANAFTSLAFHPESGTQVTVALEDLHTLSTNAGARGSRCTMNHALSDFGEITQGLFSPVVQTSEGP